MQEETVTISREEFLGMKYELGELESFRKKVEKFCSEIVDPRLPDDIYFFSLEPELPAGVTREMMLSYYGPDLVELLRLRFHNKICTQTFDRLFAAAIDSVLRRQSNN